MKRRMKKIVNMKKSWNEILMINNIINVSVYYINENNVEKSWPKVNDNEEENIYNENENDNQLAKIQYMILKWAMKETLNNATIMKILKNERNENKNVWNMKSNILKGSKYEMKQ